MSEQIVWVSYASGAYKGNIFWNKFFVKYFVKPDKIIFLTDNDLKSTNTYVNNREIFDGEKGGFYAWKPWAINYAFEQLEENDILIYHDCGKGIKYKNFFKPIKLISYIRENDILPGINIPTYGRCDKWTHAECFKLMGCDNEFYYSTPQIETAVLGFKKSEKSRLILKEWMSYCLNKDVIQSPPKNLKPHQREGFIEHRWDQSVLTNLAKKYKIKPIELDFHEVQLSKSISIIEISLWKKSSFLRKIIISFSVNFTSLYRGYKSRIKGF